MSSFGAVRPRERGKFHKGRCVRALRNAIAESSDHGVSAAGGLQLVPAPQMDHLSLQLQAHAGTDLHAQPSALRAVRRQQKKEENAKDKKEEEDFREHVAHAKDTLYDVDFSELQTEFASVRTFQSGPILDVHIHRNVCSFVQQRANRMSTRARDCAQACEKMWSAEHELLTKASATPQASVPLSAKTTYCCKQGGGQCLRKGQGYLAGLASLRLGDAICRRSPKGSKLRGLLKAAWVVLEIGDRWFSIGLQYWRPRRPTFLEMELLPELVWGCRHIKPLYDNDGNAMPTTASKLFRQLDLQEGLEVRWYKLVTFDRALPNWRPDRLLLIKPLNEFMDIPLSTAFWSGATEELAKEDGKQRKATLAAARARERATQSGVPTEEKPHQQRAPTRKSAQQEAAKARRQGAEHQLLPLPAPPLQSGEWEWDLDAAELFGPDSSDLEPGAEGTRHNPWSDDSDVDALLVNLKDPREAAFSKDGASDCVQPDWLQEEVDFDEEEVFGQEELPSFEVKKAPNPVEQGVGGDGGDGSSDDDLFARDPDDEGVPVTEGSEQKPTQERNRESGAVRRPRGQWTADRSDEQLPGCLCRRYAPDGQTHFWYGELPPGVNDSKGVHTRRRAYRHGLRSEEEALAMVESWLHINCESAAGGEIESDASDTETTSEDSSSSSSSAS